MFCCINVVTGAKFIIIWNLLYCFGAILGFIVFVFDMNPDHKGFNNFDIFVLLPKHNLIWYFKNQKTAGIFFSFIFTLHSVIMMTWFYYGYKCYWTEFSKYYTEKFFFSYFTQEAFTMIYSLMALCVLGKLNLVELIFVFAY